MLGLWAALTLGLLLNWLPVQQMFLGTLAACIVLGLLPPSEAFAGFGHEATISIALLYVVAYTVQSTRILDSYSHWIIGRPQRTVGRQLWRFLPPVAVLSAFTNNTTVVAALLPVVQRWARKNNVPVGKLLMPLSFATILGGLCTLIGTNTNLVLDGFLTQAGQPGFAFFEFAKIGVPLAILGLVYITLVSVRLLPGSAGSMQQFTESVRQFVIEAKVTAEFEGIGKTLEQAGLRHLPGAFLFQIERDGQLIASVTSNEVIREGDRLFFNGLPASILELQRSIRGLATVTDQHFGLHNYDSDQFRVYEAVVSHSSPLLGQSVRDSQFRMRYNAVILGIHRNGERIEQKVGDIELSAGDTLLLLAPVNFDQLWYNSREFYLVSAFTEQEAQKPQTKAWIAVSAFVGMVVLVTLEVLPLGTAALLAVMVMILTRCINPRDARQAIDWGVIITIACSLGIGKAVQHAGLPQLLADSVAHSSQSGLPLLVILAGLYALTNIYTIFVTNSAAAALMAPVALSMAAELHLPAMPFMLLVAFAASADFSMPFGYQTNLMVYGPGGYKIRDYLRAGAPLNLIMGTGAVLLAYWLYF